MSGHTENRFRITWRDDAYYVSIPNYTGGEVVPAEIADDLLAALKATLPFIANDDSPGGCTGEHHETCAHCAAIEAVRAAIIKAEGPGSVGARGGENG